LLCLACSQCQMLLRLQQQLLQLLLHCRINSVAQQQLRASNPSGTSGVTVCRCCAPLTLHLVRQVICVHVFRLKPHMPLSRLSNLPLDRAVYPAKQLCIVSAGLEMCVSAPIQEPRIAALHIHNCPA
jgi:hypothetical protein